MKRGAGIFAVIIMAVFAMNSCKKDDNNNNSTSQTDRTFVRMASMSNYAEISAGRIAADRAQDSSIAAYGRMMVTDHTDASQQLRTLVSSLNDVDSTMLSDSLDAAHMALRDSLYFLSGQHFDTVYIQSQIRDHVKAIALFQSEANVGSNTKLRNFANNLIPKLQMHLMMADSLARNP